MSVVNSDVMTLQQLSRWIARGEGAFLEFKKRVPAPERVAKEVIAFANTRGGRVLIGIQDDGSVVGVKDAAEEEYALEHAIARHSDPPVAFAIERVPVTSKRDAIVVMVRESRNKPHFLVHGGARTAYIRVDDMSLEASREAVRLMRPREEDVLIKIREKERLLLRYLDHYGKINVRQFARLAGISRKMASHTLVLLTRADMLEHHPDENEDFFTHGKELSDAYQTRPAPRRHQES